LLQLQFGSAQLPTTNAVNFFTNLSTRLLQQEFGFGLEQVQISPTNGYTPAVHRLFQVTANLWETTTDPTNNLPTVFRPRFTVTNGVVYLSGYTVVTNATELDGLPLVDLAGSPQAAGLIPASGDALVYGVPLVIGARKGLPNFNEFQIAPEFTFARKIQLVKPSASSTTISQTNQLFTMSLTLPMAAEFWNPYLTNFTNAVTVCITNRATLVLTNDLGVNYTTTFVAGDRYETNFWSRFNSASPAATTNKYSFVTMLRTNLPVLPTVGTNVGYIPNVGFVSANNSNLFDTSQNLLMPRWGMVISNRVQAMIVDQGTGRLIDCVLLGNLTCATNLTEVFAKPVAWLDDFYAGGATSIQQGFESCWVTNAVPGSPHITGRIGVMQQINIARGDFGSAFSPYWKSYGKLSPEFSTIASAISFFHNFLSSSATTNKAIVPFSPVVQFALPLVWQANDPLVHYLAEDMFYADLAEAVPVRWVFPPQSSYTLFGNIGKLNDRYQPWGSNPVFGPDNSSDRYDVAIKDARAISPNQWNFPTNQTLTSGSSGQVHRGTPWQTIYLKAADFSLTNSTYTLSGWLTLYGNDTAAIRWKHITGNRDLTDGFHSRPVQDRPIVTLLQRLLNTNSPQHLLSVNDRNPANWRAVLDGMMVLTNTSPTQPVFESLIMTSNAPQAALIADAIAAARRNQPGQVFNNVGELLSTPELSLLSPWLNLGALNNSLTDEAIECIPAQLLSLVREDSAGEVRINGASVTLRFSGFDGHAYAIEQSTNCASWQPVSTNWPVAGQIELTLPLPASAEAFYRSVLLP
jgi:hypothetical protein